MKIKLFEIQNDTREMGDIAENIFESDSSFLFLNDRLDKEKKMQIRDSIQDFQNQFSHVTSPFLLLPTSGTTSSHLKIVLIIKDCFLNSARRANDFLNARKNDNWLMTLPVHHVAGLSILARAYLVKGKVFGWPHWQPDNFISAIDDLKISFCSLVPTQVYDLIQQNRTAPTCLKSVLIGGSALSDKHFALMKDLGWPLVKTYGMTETSAFMSVDQSSGGYRPLPGVEVKLDLQKRLAIKSDSLFEGYLVQRSQNWDFVSKVTEGNYWSTEDQAQILSERPPSFLILGREKNMIKIKGELVNLDILNSLLSECILSLELKAEHFFIHAIPDARDENALLLLFEPDVSPDRLNALLEKLNTSLLPFEKVNRTCQVSKIPRTDLGKVNISKLKSPEFELVVSKKVKIK